MLKNSSYLSSLATFVIFTKHPLTDFKCELEAIVLKFA